MTKKIIILIILIIIIGGIYLISRDKPLEIPDDALSITELLSNPLYDKESIIYGIVSNYAKLDCPCFYLTSDEETISVWHAMTDFPPLNTEQMKIKDGDLLLITGKLREDGNFWAKSIEK